MVTFRSAVDQWLVFRARRWTCKGTEANFRAIAAGWVRVLGPLVLEEIRPLDVQRLYLDLDDGRRSGAWLDKSRDTLRSFWGWAVDLELVVGNPITKHSWPRLGTKKRSARSRVHIEISVEILERILDLTPIRYHRILLFMWLIGTRISESIKADWSWVIQDSREENFWIIAIPDEAVKQRIGYQIPIGSRILRLLGPRKEGRLFPEAPKSATTIRHMLSRVGSKIGIRISPHQFRRSCATNLANSGMALPMVQRALGWNGLPRNWLKMFEQSYYLGLNGSRFRSIQDSLYPD